MELLEALECRINTDWVERGLHVTFLMVELCIGSFCIRSHKCR